jgi:hypothetical protein
VQNIRIEVTDRDGWRKEFSLQKTISYIGGDARNDIVLDTSRGAGASPRHLQLISTGSAIRLVNIGSAEISITLPGEASVAAGRAVGPMSSADIMNGSLIKLGDFMLRLRLPEVAPAAAPVLPQAVGAAAVAAAFAPRAAPPVADVSAAPTVTHPAVPFPEVAPVASAAAANPDAGIGDAIGLRIQLVQTVLGPDRPLEGSVVVRNAGTRPGAQFKLEILGLEAGSYEIGAGPILFPNAEKEVAFKLFHTKGPRPPAGELRVLIRATAPDAYPGQSAVVSQVVQVMPYYSHTVTLIATE